MSLKPSCPFPRAFHVSHMPAVHTHGVCEDMFTPMFMLKLMMSTSVWAHTGLL